MCVKDQAERDNMEKEVLFTFPKPGKIEHVILPNLFFLKEERNRIREACIYIALGFFPTSFSQKLVNDKVQNSMLHNRFRYPATTFAFLLLLKSQK